MKVCVLGAGSLGSTIGGALALDGHEVYLVARAAHVHAMNQDGLVLVTDSGEDVAHVRGCETPDGIGVCDLVIVLCKAYDTRATAESALELVGPDTVVVSLQNGLGAEDILSEIFGAEHVIGGKTYIGGMLLEPGRVKGGIAGKETFIGELDGTVTPRVQAIADAFEAAGMHTVASDNIMGVIWDKLLINLSTGALCALSGLPYGWLYQIPEIRETALAAVQEGIDIAHAAGVELRFETPEESWELAREGLSFDFKPSLQQSLESGRRTEIDVIAGAAVREGKKYGIPTPVNSTLVALVKGREKYNEEYGNFGK